MPRGWTVAGRVRAVEATRGKSLVSATRFALVEPYTPALFARAARELDRLAVRLATRSHGKLTESTTTTVDGRRIRAYRFRGRTASGTAYDERIGFVLVGKREYQLLCQADAGAGDPDGACALLFSTFSGD